jgi:integrase
VVLPVSECAALLRAAEKFEKGKLVPYVALCLFGGLRPFEAARLTWEQVNLTDGEIRLKGTQTKTGKGRIVVICKTLKAWLSRYRKAARFTARRMMRNCGSCAPASAMGRRRERNRI